MLSEILTISEILLVGEHYVLARRIGARDVLYFRRWKSAWAGCVRYSCLPLRLTISVVSRITNITGIFEVVGLYSLD